MTIPLLAFFTYLWGGSIIHYLIVLGVEWDLALVEEILEILMTFFNVCCSLLLYIDTGGGKTYYDINQDTLASILFFWQGQSGLRLSKTKMVSIVAFALNTIFTVHVNFNLPGFDLSSVIVISMILGLILTVPVFVIGYVLHRVVEGKIWAM